MKRRLFVTKGLYDDARNTLSRVEEERKDGVFFFLLRSMIDIQRISILKTRNSSIFFSGWQNIEGWEFEILSTGLCFKLLLRKNKK